MKSKIHRRHLHTAKKVENFEWIGYKVIKLHFSISNKTLAQVFV
jgi:hypothetical protein